jgi:predicted secreted protein
MKTISAFLLVILLTGCDFPKLEKEAPAVNDLKKGTKFRVNLPEDHTTGYTWYLSEDFDNKIIHRLNDVWHGNEKGIDFNLKAASAGQTTLTFVSRKYTDTASYKKYIVSITE